MRVRLLATATLSAVFAASCQTVPPASRSFAVAPEKLIDAVRAALAEGGEVEQRNGTFTTGWQNDNAARLAWNRFGQPVQGQSQYRVKLEGIRVEVVALSRVFVSFGPHARRWETVGSIMVEERLIARIGNRLE